MHSLTSSVRLSRRQLGQLAARLAALVLIYLLLSSDGSLLGLTDRYGARAQAILYGQWLLQSAIFYGFGYWLFPGFLYRFRPFPLLTILGSTYVVVFMLNYASFVWLHQTANFPVGYQPDSDMAEQWRGMVGHGPLGILMSPALVLLTFRWSFAYPALLLAAKAFYDNRTAQVNTARLKEQNVQLELDYLKSQINPHFLFNVLHSVYALTEEDCPRAAQLVHQLSGLMQYTLYETTEPIVPLHKELQFIRDYVALEKNRAGKRVDLRVDLPEFISETLQIVPFLLIPFVENAFKHGVQRSAQKSWVHLQVSVTGNILYLSVSNSKPAAPELTTGGLGVANASKRLAGFYPTHRLQLINETTHYTVFLSVALNAS